MKYKNIVLTKRGGPEVLEIQVSELREPKSEEVQIKVLSCGVGRTDVAMRYGYYPYAPKIPFVPGYEIVGEVTAVGPGASQYKVGDRVAALTVHGGYSEYLYLEEEHLIPVPEKVRPDEAVALILNYCTAYQILHRVLKVKKGESVLITGASGGVGSALIDLGKIVGLNMYGTASRQKHVVLKEQGVEPLDYKSADWLSELRKMKPEGVDYVIDGIGGKYINKGFLVLRRGGKLVDYAYPNFLGMLSGMLKISLLNFAPNSKKGEFYGISASYKKDKSTVIEDIRKLFDLLNEGKIKPLISDRLPILEAARANELLESGGVTGKLVLVAPELN